MFLVLAKQMEHKRVISSSIAISDILYHYVLSPSELAMSAIMCACRQATSLAAECYKRWRHSELLCLSALR